MKKLLLATFFILGSFVFISMAQSPTTVPKPKKKTMPEERKATVKGKSDADRKSDADFRKNPGAKINTDSDSLKDLKLKGKWKTTKGFYDGKQVKIEGMFVTEEIEFAEDGKFTMQAGGKEFFGTYELDTTKSPMWITIKYDDETEQPFRGSLIRGIFGITGDQLTIVTNVQKRPEELSSKENSLNTLMEFERIDEEEN